MRRVRVVGSQIVSAEIAERRSERMRGLIGAPPETALLLPRARSVHTFGLTRPIDVILLDGRLRVLRILRVRPRRIVLPRPRARYVLELDRSPFAIGEMLRVRDYAAADVPSAERESDGGEQEGGQRGERDDRDGQRPPGPRGERHRLSPPGRWSDQAEELQQRAHGIPSAARLRN